jgi:hypothetical protein
LLTAWIDETYLGNQLGWFVATLVDEDFESFIQRVLEVTVTTEADSQHFRETLLQKITVDTLQRLHAITR